MRSTAPSWRGTPVDDRTDLERLAAGEPVLLEQVDLIAFANSDWAGLDPRRDPGTYTLAEVMLDWYHRHVGTDRRTKGDRAGDLAVSLRRYLLPFAVETGYTVDDHRVGAFRLQHAEDLISILAGTRPLPAATVAGDRLGRYGVACVWLSLADAAEVSDGGADAVARATRSGRLPTHTTNTGQRVVAAADLRVAGLLLERSKPHGLAPSTAGNHVRILVECLARADDLGATVTGKFRRVTAVEPLSVSRQRPESEPLNGAVSIDQVAAVCAYLSPVMQVALWLLRLTGMRIGEAYGLHLEDYSLDDEGRGWLAIHTQGGSESLVRDELGKLRVATTKPHTKTKQSVRTIPIPDVLRRLLDEAIRVYHVDAQTGLVDRAARLIPGLRTDDDGGIAALRAALDKAIGEVTARGRVVPSFTPHDLRASWITDMYDHGAQVEERLHEWYTGHAVGTTVHRSYDRGPDPEQWLRIVAVVEENVARAGIANLCRPTAVREGFGRATRRGARAPQLRAELSATGWLLPRGAEPPLPQVRATRRNSSGRVSASVPSRTDADAAPDEYGHGASDAVPSDPRHVGSVDHADDLLDSAGVARLAGVTPTTARRWLREGFIPTVPATWGSRPIQVARAADVDAFLARRTRGTTLTDLAATTGWTYHQLFRLVNGLGIVANGPRGAAIRLSPAQVARVQDEVERRSVAAAQAVPVAEAATRLAMEVLTVEALLRRGELALGTTPDATRHRYVTVASIDAYLARHPVTPAATYADERLVPQGIARQALRLTRPQLRFLVASRQLIARTPRRRLYLTLASIEHYAAPYPHLADAVALCRASSRPA